MNNDMKQCIEKLLSGERLTREEFCLLIQERTKETASKIAEEARRRKQAVYGDSIFLRGIVEFSNVCKNDCYYCGIRKSNEHVRRYRLSKEEILQCCRAGYEIGMRTFVLQSGEDGAYTDSVLEEIIRGIKKEFPDCAVTLSLGERDKDSYQRLYDAGADRYLLRHETADPEHYRKLHPEYMSFEHRMHCLYELREIGYDVGAGMMVGSPYQTERELAEDLYFIQDFRPEMCGIGPFIPHRDTPFRDQPAGTLEMTLFLLSVIRLIEPEVLLPATTALGTIDPRGREKGVLAGANVIMPNLSPVRVRHQYELYDNKICMDDEAGQCGACIELRMRTVGSRIAVDRGDIRRDGFRSGILCRKKLE
ncbi:MAG: [FeFe] hydrogenase H-cluster radical SAM maturase HydE [Eubacteriales bacterium]|nr:[FeFe] hydrogenase H-cluster radical SAM maturase HydE [Eubacteriales bacterium]